MSRPDERWDVVAVGAGPAGCEFAYQMARAKSRDRNRVLSWLGRKELPPHQISSIVGLYRGYGSVEFTQRLIHHLRGAISEISSLPKNGARSTLKEIAEILDSWTRLAEQ